MPPTPGWVLCFPNLLLSNKNLHPCAFLSDKLSSAERNYDIRNCEGLAVKLALEEHCHWMEGASLQFIVWSDQETFPTSRPPNIWLPASQVALQFNINSPLWFKEYQAWCPFPNRFLLTTPALCQMLSCPVVVGLGRWPKLLFLGHQPGFNSKPIIAIS